MDTAEIWKDIEGYETHYQVSTLGNVRSKERIVSDSRIPRRVFKSRPIKPWNMPHGYFAVSLSKQGKVKKYTIHKLVCTTFLVKLPHHQCVNHKDGNKKNNNVSNLEWCTYSHNNQHAYDAGLKKPTVGKVRAESHAFKSKIVATSLTDGVTVDMFGPKDMRAAGFDHRSVYACTTGSRKAYKGHTFERVYDEMV
jgi:hypothetical protein